MKTVISASRRTDIPAYYLKWLISHCKEGKITVRNPLYKQNVRTVDLRPEAVEWIVFWSRNYGPFLNNKSAFSDYNLFFHFTVLSHTRHLEKSHITLNRALDQASRLAGFYGGRRIIWRYDPLVFWQDGNQIKTNFNKQEFTLLCREMSSFGIYSCYFSVATPYRKFEIRFKKAYPFQKILGKDGASIKSTIREMQAIADQHKVHLFSCCNDLLVGNGIQKGRCINGELLNNLGNRSVTRAAAPSREDCGCTRSVDIGDYDMQPCPTGCIYCYANPLWEQNDHH